MSKTAAHLQPANCYVCGQGSEDHGADAGHKYWSNADAAKEFAQEPAGPGGAESRYVEQHRPY